MFFYGHMFYVVLKTKGVRADIEDEDDLEAYLQYVEDHKVRALDAVIERWSRFFRYFLYRIKAPLLTHDLPFHRFAAFVHVESF